jgi:ABC-type ATPase with predicted acetyltransferase domain
MIGWSTREMSGTSSSSSSAAAVVVVVVADFDRLVDDDDRVASRLRRFAREHTATLFVATLRPGAGSL